VSGGHPVHITGRNALYESEAVAVHQRALKQIGHRGQPDMRMRAHIDRLPRLEANRTHMIEKNERTNGATPRSRQKTPDFKTVAEVFGMRLKDLADHNDVGGSESGVLLIIDG
jgi:hypothetical protein